MKPDAVMAISKAFAVGIFVLTGPSRFEVWMSNLLQKRLLFLSTETGGVSAKVTFLPRNLAQ